MTNKKLGNDFELKFCEILSNAGFWVHNLAQNQAGQPADVIAARNGKTYLIDCKVCGSRGFALSRVEENQELSMDMWAACDNGVGWFAMKIDDGIYMVTHSVIKMLQTRQTHMKDDDIRGYGISLKVWLDRA